MTFTMEYGTGFETGRIITRAGRTESTGAGVSTLSPHTGLYCASVSYTGVVGGIRVTPTGELYLSCWVRPFATVGEYTIRFKRDDGGGIDLRYTCPGPFWDVYIGSALVASGAVGTTYSEWAHVQMHVLLGGEGVGIIETIIDGVPDVSYLGANAGSATTIESALVTKSGTVAYLDDFCFGTGGWPGDIRFDPVYVSGDVAGECDWEPSTGTDHYALVDEVPPDSADYVYAEEDLGERYTTPGTWDDTDGLGNVVKMPIAVTVWADVRKEDGNQDDQLSLVQSDGTIEVAQAAEYLLTSYEHRWFIRELAPDGGEWTTAKVNQLVIGLESDVEEAV